MIAPIPGTRKSTNSTPSLKRCSDWWRALPKSDLLATFPEIVSSYIGWGEPFCFKCGWLAPVPDGADAWPAATGWLEVAHLADWCVTGSNAPQDCVPLCIECHADMPPCATREEGVAWVSVRRRKDPFWQLFTDDVFQDCIQGLGTDFGRRKTAIKSARRAFRHALDLASSKETAA